MKPLLGKTVLVVDDEPMLREIISDELKEVGAEIIEAGNGREAIAMIGERQIDCVVTDVHMPGGDGVELLEKIRLKDPRFPSVILITGHSDFSLETAHEKGANAVVGKPFDCQDLVRTVVLAVFGPPCR